MTDEELRTLLEDMRPWDYAVAHIRDDLNVAGLSSPVAILWLVVYLLLLPVSVVYHICRYYRVKREVSDR